VLFHHTVVKVNQYVFTGAGYTGTFFIIEGKLYIPVFRNRILSAKNVTGMTGRVIRNPSCPLSSQ
jgi:hypothetical protein